MVVVMVVVMRAVRARAVPVVLFACVFACCHAYPAARKQ